MTWTEFIQLLLVLAVICGVHVVLRGHRRNRVSKWRHVIRRMR